MGREAEFEKTMQSFVQFALSFPGRQRMTASHSPPRKMNQPEGRPTVSKEAGFDVFEFQRLAQRRIVVEVNLPDGKIIRRAPVIIHFALFFLRERPGSSRGFDGICERSGSHRNSFHQNAGVCSIAEEAFVPVSLSA
jgi:hypothetical protein